MTLYEINNAILDLVNEDGEIADFEEFDKLQLEREKKLENVACYIKNLNAEAAAIKAEEDALNKRRTAAENKVQSLKCYLDHALQGDNFKTSKVLVGYRNSTQCVVDESFIEWANKNADHLLRYKQPEPNKTAIKECIVNGELVPFAKLETIRNIYVR